MAKPVDPVEASLAVIDAKLNLVVAKLDLVIANQGAGAGEMTLLQSNVVSIKGGLEAFMRRYNKRNPTE